MRQVEIQWEPPSASFQNRSLGNDVAGASSARASAAIHETVSVGPPQQASFAANRFEMRKFWPARVEEAGGGTERIPGSRPAVPHGRPWRGRRPWRCPVRGVEIHLSLPPVARNDGPGGYSDDPVGDAVQDMTPSDPVPGREVRVGRR